MFMDIKEHSGQFGNFRNCFLVTHKAKIVSSEPEHKDYTIHVSICIETYQNVSKYVNMYQNVSKMHQKCI